MNKEKLNSWIEKGMLNNTDLIIITVIVIIDFNITKEIIIISSNKYIHSFNYDNINLWYNMNTYFFNGLFILKSIVLLMIAFRSKEYLDNAKD